MRINKENACELTGLYFLLLYFTLYMLVQKLAVSIQIHSFQDDWHGDLEGKNSYSCNAGLLLFQATDI